MLIPLTMATLALQTILLVVLRIFWLRVSSSLRWTLIRVALFVMLVGACFTVTKWGTTSAYANVVINWLAVASYEFLVLLFAGLPPRWLTSISAFILLVPLFASSILLPLTSIFQPGALAKRPVEKHIYYKVVPWSNNGAGNSGVDVDIYSRSAVLPFLSRKVDSEQFNEKECNAFAAEVIPGPVGGTVIARCPNWPSQAAGAEERVIRLGAM